MLLSSINMNLFSPWFSSLGEQGTPFSHPVRVGLLSGYKNTWFCKRVADENSARYEQFAKEIYRLFNPKTQPKTLIASDDQGHFYLLSEAVTDFTPLPHKRGYELRMMPALYELKKDRFYVSCNEHGDLEYAVFDPTGKLILDKITEKKLKSLGIYLKSVVTEEELLEQVAPQFSNILNITSEAGHTERKKDGFTDGRFTGLGGVLVPALWMDESDLKNGNIGLNDEGKVVEVDAGECWATLLNRLSLGDNPHRLSTRLIESLPLIPNYQTYNWLDIDREGARCMTSNLFDFTLINAPHFRAEVNKALLQIILTPNGYLTDLAETFLNSNDRGRFTKFLIQRREKLQEEALKSTSFLTYLSMPQAQEDTIAYLEHMKGFKTQSNVSITHPSKHCTLMKAVQFKWKRLGAPSLDFGFATPSSPMNAEWDASSPPTINVPAPVAMSPVSFINDKAISTETIPLTTFSTPQCSATPPASNSVMGYLSHLSGLFSRKKIIPVGQEVADDDQLLNKSISTHKSDFTRRVENRWVF